MVETAPNPDLLAAIDALDTATPGPAPTASDAQPETSATTPGPDAAPDPQPPHPTEPPAAPDAAPDAQRAGETDRDYKARYEEAQRQIANREWSSQGRYLQEKARREALETRVRELEAGFADEDAYRRTLYDTAIAQAETPEQRDFLSQKRDLELQQRQFRRQQATEEAGRQATQAEQEAGRQATLQFHERTMRTEALPELERQLAEVGEQYALPAEELAPLRAQLRSPALRHLVEQAPPQLLGQAVIQMIQQFHAEARDAQQRVAERNRRAASQAGTYRGPVESASAGASAAGLARFAGTGDLEGAIDALFPD